MAPPATKKAKTEEKAVAKAEVAAAPGAEKANPEEKAPEKEKFQEPDAATDSRPTLKEKIGFATADTSLNVIPAVGGKVLNCLTDGGMSCLLAGARANVGQKAGRYMFEAKILQVTDPSYGRDKQAKQALRIGFSTSSSGLVLGEDASSVYFDSEGYCVAAKKKSNVKGGIFGKGQVIAVVLNLDPKSENANTVALYRDGAVVGDPIPLPEDLKGKTLFPHLTFRKVSVQVNHGPAALKELPFKCRLLQDAANSDVSVSASKEPKDGKYEVILPVGVPDEGTFVWLDAFLEKNPQYVELSDRKILKWANASGLTSNNQDRNQKSASLDKPAFNFGIREMDDFSVRKVLSAIAPVVPRNYLIMEVKSNFVAAEREEVLKKFNYPCYKRTAKVIMGEPNKEYKAMVQSKILKDKQAKSDIAWKATKVEKARKKALEAKKKETEKKAIEAKALKEKKAAEAKAQKEKKEAEAKEKKEGDDKKEEEKKDEPMEEKKEEKAEEKKEEVKEPEEPEEPEETEPPVVELTEEEKKQNHATKRGFDLSLQVMNSNFSKFSIPAAAEGFDDIQYEWQKAAPAAQYLKEWILNRKLTTRIDDIKPGQLFKEKQAEFKKLSKEWNDKLAAFKKGGSKKPAKKSEEEDDVDIFSVADVSDVGEGVPLFDQFTADDWELLKLRFELALLCLSFKEDCNDTDRAGIPFDHFGFYFQKYFNEQLNPKRYGMTDIKGVLGLIKETVAVKDGLLVSQIESLDGLDSFVKLTEEHRRERQRRIDAGDETARLKFVTPAEPKALPKVEAKPAATKAVVSAVPAKVVAATKGAGVSVPATKGAAVVPAGKGKDAKGKDGKDGKGKGKGKDDNKGFGKVEQKGWGKEAKGFGKEQKGWGKEQKGYGKGKW